MSSNYQQKKMMNALGAIDTKGNIVLKQFQDGTALLFQPGNAQPFCVATDYDRATASWSYGKYFSDLGCAYEAADPEIIEDASVRWVKEDIREKLKAQDIAPTEFNVQSVIMGDSRLWERPLDRDFRDNMIASGNDDLDARVAILKENGKPFYEARFKDENGNIFARKTDDAEDIRFDSPDQVDLSQLHDSAVVEDSRAKKHTAPGKLLDLAGLSAILAKQGFKPANVLKTYQEMYENQIVSYPRTEDKEVTPEQFGELLPLVDKIAGVVGVDTSLLSHRAARKTHVKEGGAHGANRPGINVPESLAELEKGYGKIGSAIYSVLAKNYLAMLAEDYEYELVKGYVRDFPEYVGQTQIPIKPGFKAIFDSDSSSTEKAEGEETENACEFGKVASPYVHEGANKRPQKPTMKWLTKKLEKYNVGTGATRTSTLAEITANEERALMKENKGALTMTKCGEVSYALLANCQIASPEVTEKLFESMNEVGRFSRKPSDVINTVTDMVVHDMRAMQDNIGALDGMKLGDGNAIVIGKCPKCGKDLYATKNQFRCAGVHFKKTGEKDGKSVFAHVGTCDFFIYRFVGPKDKPKKLTDKNGREIAEKGKTSLIKGIKKKSGDGTYDAYLTLNRETWSLDMQFPEFKGKKHKG